LIGLGITLIFAHNWDDLSRSTKTIISFIPLLVGQFLCGYTILKKSESTAWRESSSVFLFLAIGTSISLISQIYNIPGKLSSFLITWMLLALPIVYLVRSSVVSLFYIIGISYYTLEVNFWSYPHEESQIYWLLFLLIVPYYSLLIKKHPSSNFTIFHHWIIPIAILSTFGTLGDKNEELMVFAYLILCGVFYIIGSIPVFQHQKWLSNGYLNLGSLGTVGILLFTSFKFYWKEIAENNYSLLSGYPELTLIILLTLVGIVLTIATHFKKPIQEYHPAQFLFLFSSIILPIGFSSPLTAGALINLLILALGIVIIFNGVKENHLGLLNYGLLTLTALIACRFFDSKISFIVKGALFILAGIGFFLANYWMVQRRKKLQKQSS
jgi:uncharacterized membrane protein